MSSCLEAHSCWFGTGRRWLVADASLRVSPGWFTAVVGPNGAGKSSLLRLLSGEQVPARGSVHLNGRALEQCSLPERARQRAVLSQHLAVEAPFTALEVVLLGRSPHTSCTSTENHRIADEAMRLTEVEHLKGRLVPTLSGGERQRVHLARVLAQIWDDGQVTDGRYLLLDEPTSALDLSHQHSILRIVRDFSRRQVGALVVLHDINLAASYADQVVVMSDGRIVGAGAPDEVLQAELIQRVFGLPVLAIRHPSVDRPMFVAVP